MGKTNTSIPYVICDELPTSNLKKLVAPPVIPFFVSMLVGPLYGWTWLLVNSYFINKKISRREILFYSTGMLVTIISYSGLLWLKEWQRQFFEQSSLLMSYLLLTIVVLKMFVSYSLLSCQIDKFEILKDFYDEEGAGKRRIVNGIAIAFGLQTFAKVIVNPFLFKLQSISLIGLTYV